MDTHPLVVHFPIVLLTLAAFCDAIALIASREQFRWTGFLLLVLGTVGALVAALTGDAAKHGAGRIPGIRDALERHEDLATVLIWSAVVLTLGRAHFVLKKRFEGAVRAVFLVLSLAVAALALASGYTGGKMVYEYGAGTRPVMEQVRAQEAEEAGR